MGTDSYIQTHYINLVSTPSRFNESASNYPISTSGYLNSIYTASGEPFSGHYLDSDSGLSGGGSSSIFIDTLYSSKNSNVANNSKRTYGDGLY